jgi:hypothetical protein
MKFSQQWQQAQTLWRRPPVAATSADTVATAAGGGEQTR